MDSIHLHSSEQDSRRSRSRASGHHPSTASQIQTVTITSSSRPEISRAPASQTSSPASYPPASSLSSNNITAPVPQPYTNFPLLSQNNTLEPDWSYLNQQAEPSNTPLLQVQPPQQSFLGADHHLRQQLSPRPPHPPAGPTSNPANMTSVGVHQYEPKFDAGIRGAYTWPHFEMNEQFMPEMGAPQMHPGPLPPQYEDPKLMPMYARSLSSSPPRGTSFTPEHRELKRQLDHARRDSKNRMRRDRSDSSPYAVSQNPSPDMLPRSLPGYQHTLSPPPLLSQGSPTIANNGYLAPYSPHLSDPGAPDIYGPVFTMSPNDITSAPAYTMPYPGDHSLSYAPRPHTLSTTSEPGHMYQSHPGHAHPHLQHALPQHARHQSPPKMSMGIISSGPSSDSGDHVRVVHSRPKPQCWDHGCNGRQFSTFSNLLRHQREKSGVAAKSSCPNCGAEFTRTTARNGHMAHEKCKQRRNS